MGSTETWNPGKLLEISGYYWKTCTLHAGVKLGLFTAIGDKPTGAPELAKILEADERGLAMLLNALTAMGLIEKTGEKYANTPTAGPLLRKDSPRYIGFMIMHHHHLVSSWSRLDEAVKSGKPVRGRELFEDEVERESFLMGMFNIAMGTAPLVADHMDLSGRRRLLDLGGGPGTYAIHFLLKNPELTATIFDLPTTRPFAEKTVQRFNLEERIDFQAGDFSVDPISGTHDLVWLSHIVHGEAPEDCRKLLKKAVSALAPGGMIMIHDFFLEKNRAAPLFPTLFSLNMLACTPGGQSYSEAEIRKMLEEAGVKEIRRSEFTGPNDSGIITGTV